MHPGFLRLLFWRPVGLLRAVSFRNGRNGRLHVLFEILVRDGEGGSIHVLDELYGAHLHNYKLGALERGRKRRLTREER